MNEINLTIPSDNNTIQQLKQRLPNSISEIFLNLYSRSLDQVILETKEKKCIKELSNKDLINAQKTLLLFEKTFPSKDEKTNLATSLLTEELSNELNRREKAVISFLFGFPNSSAHIGNSSTLTKLYKDYLTENKIDIANAHSKHIIRKFLIPFSDEMLLSDTAQNNNPAFISLKEVLTQNTINQIKDLNGDQVIRLIDKKNKNFKYLIAALAVAGTMVVGGIIALNILFFPIALYVTLGLLFLLAAAQVFQS